MVNREFYRLLPLWETVHDCYYGAVTIGADPKAKRYLPPQPSEIEEMESGKVEPKKTRYEFRKALATYDNFFRPTIDDIVGIMQKNPAILHLGKDDNECHPAVKNIQEWGNRYDDGLVGLKNRLNFAQALYGRYGLLLDIVADSNGFKPQFCISEYNAIKILDGEVEDSAYDTKKELKWILLDESTRRFDPIVKTWIDWPRRRILGLDENKRYYNALIEGADVEARWAQFNILKPEAENLIYPRFEDRELDFIPFTVCDVNRLGIEKWQAPPYLDVANLALKNYNIDSWYKMALYHYSSPTLVITNATREQPNVRLGGVVWLMGNGQNPIQVNLLETSGGGLGEMRSAKQELKEALKYSSIRDLLDGAGASSSGEAIKLRTASGTATIAALDKAGARAIEEQMCFAAIWTGMPKEQVGEKVRYTADTSYLGEDIRLDTVVSLLSSNKELNFFSNRAMYNMLERCAPGMLPSYEDNEAQKALDAEAKDLGGGGVNIGLSSAFRPQDAKQASQGQAQQQMQNPQKAQS